MSSCEYIQYRGIILPPVAHNMESLEYAQNFPVEDTDVFAVTYPKSGDTSLNNLNDRKMVMSRIRVVNLQTIMRNWRK